MCDACIMNAVKDRMMSRRDLFRGSAATAAGIAAAGMLTAPREALAAGHSRVVDMSYTVSPEFPTYFGRPGMSIEPEFTFAENGFNVFKVSHNEHLGTHIDAPLHFSADGQSVDEIPLDSLVAPLAVIDVREKAAANPNYELSPDDVKAWTDRYGDLPEGCCVAMNSGWQARIGGDGYRNADADGKQHYPGFHVETAKMLMEDANVVGLASDTLSLDIGASETFDTHYAWLPTNRYGIENLANVGDVPENGATLIVGAPKHKGGSGGPSRVMALV